MIEIYVNYYGDGKCNVSEVYVNKIRKAKFDYEKGKIDLSILEEHEGSTATLTATHVNDIAKNHSYLVKIKAVETDPKGLHVLHYDRI